MAITLEDLHAYCLTKTGAVQEYPFGNDVRVFKVKGKMFAAMPEGKPSRITLKCDPVEAELLRQQYEAVKPGYHMNKKHWNTITVDGSVPDERLREMIDDSYALVVKTLTKADREDLAKRAEKAD